MHDLLGTKIVLALSVVFLFHVQLFGQGGAVQSYSERMARLSGGREIRVRGMNKPNYDDKFLHYGFYVGMNYNSFRIQRSEYFNEQLSEPSLWDTTANRPLYGINPKGTSGLTVGFILNMGTDRYPWMSYFDLRILPNVTFYQRYLEFRFAGDSTVPHLHQSTYSYIEIPILVKYKSKRRNNVRMYLVGGIKPSLEVGGRREDLTDEVLRITNTDFALEYGFGVELFYPYFNLSPELRFSHGVQNLWTADPNVYSRSVDRIFSHSVTLIFNFEG